MSAPAAPDNHAAMTGPSYRGVGATHRATRVAQAPPTTAPADQGSFIERRLRDVRAKAAANNLAAAQAEAERLRDELRPFFATRYGKYAGKAKHRPGALVAIKVLDRADFAASLATFADELLAEEWALVTKYIPLTASKEISGYGRSGDVVLIPVTTSTKLTSAQLQRIRPDSERTGSAPGGFYSSARATIFVRVDQVDAGVVAHELCHSYASASWNELDIALTLQRVQVDVGRPDGKVLLVRLAFDVDEGITSKLAQYALDDWYSAPTPPGMLARPATLPNALVGYLPSVLTTADNFIRGIDGTLGTPRANTLRSYFGGDLTFTIDEEHPLESVIRCGGAKQRKLRDLL